MNDIHQITDLGGTTHDIKDYRIPTFPADTKQFLNGNGAWATLVDAIYPVGSIYISTNSTNPGTLFGGTWTALENRFLVGAGDLYTAGAEGGEATHTLSIEEMPAHVHYPKGADASANGNWCYTAIQNRSQHSGTYPLQSGEGKYGFGSNDGYSDLYLAFSSGSAGGGVAHNNMPPYLSVYMWERTA